ncbi:hypothetical protein AALO_G00229100 [Alosa alosa]|uniref:C2H2-type domain-containing protein n=1 Tax=Alosa alosa TaxID=278164 RepID=A0AAV6FYK3_9TELE|nr:hypothetical protein AALO_G00229100 [Alosa alosa]
MDCMAKASTSTSRATTETPKAQSRATTETPKAQVSTPAPVKTVDQYEYYDAGNHWCKNCNITCGAMFDFFTHLHSKSHRKSQDPYDRPWAPDTSSVEKKKQSGVEKITKPAKGSEFLMAVRGFYCQLCKEFFGDPICAEEHVTSHAHNEKYKQRMYENPLYEQRRNLDRQAGMTISSESKHAEQKRKQEAEHSREEFLKRSKHGKEEEQRPTKQQKEEETPTTKPRYVREEVKKPAYDPEDEDGKFKNSRREQKEEKPRYSKREEEEDRPKYGRMEEEEDRPKYGRREEEEDRPKYGRMEEEEDRPKYSRREEEEVRPKYMKKEKEEEERKSKYSKKEEGEGRSKYSQRDEEETRSKYSRRAEDDSSRGKHSKQQQDEEQQRNRYAREEDERASYGKADDRGRYGRAAEKRSRCSQEEPERKPKHGKWEDEEDEVKPKWTREERAPAPRKERGYRNKPEKGGKKEEKPEVLEKPVEPPKVMCGPSPAMLAKLRKKNEEANKGGTFGKFTWKKPQKSKLEKEAERMAAQFIKEDEEAAKAAEQVMLMEPGAVVGGAGDAEDGEDAFARSLAAAKTIAIKLAGKTVLPTPAPWQSFGVSPSAMVLRKSAANNPSPVNPALAMKPVSVTPVKAPTPTPAKEEKKDAVLSADVISKAFGGQEVQLPPIHSTPPATSDLQPAIVAAQQSAPATAEPALAPEPQPGVCVMRMEADVAVPGVSECEQAQAVVVCPPPMLQKPPTNKNPPRSVKPKSSLAAAKAQDLFDIFYSGGSPFGTPTSSTAPKPAQVCPKADAKDAKSVGISQSSLEPSVSMKMEKHTPVVVMETVQTVESVQSEADDPIQLVVIDSVQLEPEDPIQLKTGHPLPAVVMEPIQLDSDSDDSIPHAVMDAVHSEIDNPIVIETVSLEPDDPSAEDAMAIILGSDSPPPGSFTEQINLDTFEFNFEPPE